MTGRVNWRFDGVETALASMLVILYVWHFECQYRSNTGWLHPMEESLTHDRGCESRETRRSDCGVGAMTSAMAPLYEHILQPSPLHP